MRRDRFEIGLEREYALYAWLDGAIAYLLASDRLLAAFESIADQRWQRMHADGWRLAPEYSKCLVEIASPPVVRDGWPELLAGFAVLEDWLARAAEMLGGPFDRVECTAAYSVRTDRFITWDGAFVTAYADLLLVGAHENWLVGSFDRVPPCFAGSVPELLYAGFTSTNATVHPPITGSLADNAAALAGYGERLLQVARRIDAESPQRHPFLRDGRIAVPPDPDASIRDALIRWGDPDAYGYRKRVVEDTALFELRCFHSGLPLANLGSLLDAGARLIR